MKKKVDTRLKQMNDDDNVVIILYAYGFYVDDTLHGVNNNRNYHTKKDIKDNITNPDWYNAYYVSEKKQVINGKEYTVIRASLTE